MIERFRADPASAARLVNSILDDNDDQGELKIILELAAAAGVKLSVVAALGNPRPDTDAKRQNPVRATTKVNRRRTVKKTARPAKKQAVVEAV